MKKTTFILLFIALCFTGLTQIVPVQPNTQKHNRIQLVNSNMNSTGLSLTLDKFSATEVLTPRGQASIYKAPEGVSVMEKGAPDVPKFARSVIVPDKARMKVNVTNATYKEYSNILIAPSKGNLYRNINPETIPYTYSQVYNKNEFFPGKLADLGKPYILRDFRGQTVNFYPFQYNPVTKKLRVYNHISVDVQIADAVNGENQLNRTKPLTKVDQEFNAIYQRQFLNYNQSKYTPVADQGNMLIICYGNFLTDMQNFVNWKKLIGIPTEIVNVSTIGTTSASIKSYILNYYSQKGLTFVLLVGDAAQVPTNTLSTGHSDNAYGYLTGSDSYPEVFVGRFSAETTTHVQTLVKRSVDYEMSPVATPAWLDKGICMASSEGAGIGHNGGESDIQHEDHIRTDLLGYTYTTVTQLHETTSGPTVAQVAAAINGGAGIVNYTGHGSETSWGTSGFSNTNINSLTNAGKLPFIWSVGCVNGAFVNTTCFGEAWTRAISNNQPIGAVATLMSTINQSWAPPMTGQDEMNDILVESYTNNIKRTFGGLSLNGCMYMNDVHGSDGDEMTDTWNLFGDPSLMVRTDIPQTMTVTHPQSILQQETQMLVNCNVNGARVSLTVNNEIIGTGTITGGAANISFAQLPTTDSITVCVTAYNYIPYIGKVAVVDFLYNVDAGIIEIIEPQDNYNCINLNITPKAVLRNMGLNTITGVTINYKLDNGSVQQYTWNGSLVSLAKDTVSLPSFSLTAGSHTYEVYSSQPNGTTDQNVANDSKTKTFNVQDLPLTSSFTADNTNFCDNPASVVFTSTSQNAQTYLWDFGDGQTSTAQNPTHVYSALGTYTVSLTTGAGVCGQEVSTQTDLIQVGLAAPQVTPGYNCGTGTVTLNATSTGTINWYSDAAGTNLVGTGSTFTTPSISSSVTFYVQAVAANAVKHMGKLDSIGSGGYFGNTSNQHYLIFDSYVPFKLISVKVYAGSAGNRTILLRDANSNIIQQTTVNIPTGESRVTLNFDIPVGTDLQLVGGGNPNLYRNNNNSATFPYTLSGVASITETSASLAPYNTNGNYYYFYDWEVKEYDCESPLVPVQADIFASPTANFTFNVNGTVVDFTQTALQGVSYLWDFGDGSTSTQPNPTHIYSTIGTFNVKLVVTNPCGNDSIILSVTTTAAAPATDFSADVVQVYEGGTVHFSDNSANAPTSWYWMFEGGTPSSSTDQNPVVQYNTAGTYYVTLVATNSYGSTPLNKPAYIVVIPNAGIDGVNSGAAWTLYPNPASDKLFVSGYLGPNVSVFRIYNTIGSLVSETVLENAHHTAELNISTLKQGLYYLEVTSGTSRTTKKFIVIPQIH